MFDLSYNNLEPKPFLNKANIKQELLQVGYNDIDIIRYYVPEFKGINTPIKSNIRTDDKNASLHFTSRKGELKVSDFGGYIGLDVFGYLSILFYGDNSDNSYKKTLNKISNDFSLGLGDYGNSVENKTLPPKFNVQINDPVQTKIFVRYQKDKNNKIIWKDYDIEYWKQYKISTEILESKDILPIEEFMLINGRYLNFNVRNTLSYAYYFTSKDDIDYFKILSPYKTPKWISNCHKDIIQNEKFIPKSGKNLIIQSSLKDCIVMEMLRHSELDYYVMAPQGEGIWFSDEKWEEIKSNWSNIILFGNNDYLKPDNPGIKYCKQHSEKYNIPYVTTPNNTTSDISDFVKVFGLEQAKKLTNNLLSKYL
jgi:hypothetical protein